MRTLPWGARSSRAPLREMACTARAERAGAPGGIRTPDLLIRSQLLYPLSYGRIERPGRLYVRVVAESGSTPATSPTIRWLRA
jgi:hypothetical protein